MSQAGTLISNTLFAMSRYADMSHHALVGWLLDTATKQEEHPTLFKDAPPWVAGPARLRQHAAALAQKEDAAKYKDIQAVKERDSERAATLESIHSNAACIIMKARFENDESLLYNNGHEVKERSKKGHTPIPISSHPLKVVAKRGDEPGTVVLTIERDPGAGVYEVQFCKGVPTDEESWQIFGSFKKCRIFIDHLERAGWYYFRVRSHGDNEWSPWSLPVDIIVG